MENKVVCGNISNKKHKIENKVVWMIYKHNRTAIFTKRAPVKENAQSANPSGIFRVELAYSDCLAKVYKDNKFGLLPFPLTNKLLKNWSFDYETITSAEDGTTTKWYRTPTGGYDYWSESRVLEYFTKGSKKGYYAVDIRKLSDEEMEQLAEEEKTKEEDSTKAYHKRLKIRGVGDVAAVFANLFESQRKVNRTLNTNGNIKQEIDNIMEDYRHAVTLTETLEGVRVKPTDNSDCDFWLYSFYNTTYNNRQYNNEIYANWDVDETAEAKTIDEVFESKEAHCQKFVSALQWFKENRKTTEIPLVLLKSSKDFVKCIVPVATKRIWDDPHVVLVNKGYRKGIEILYRKKNIVGLTALLDPEKEEDNKQIVELLFPKLTRKTKGV